MILCVIPARGGSKSIKNKNIVKLNGKPLIWYAIKTALQCKTIDQIVVSTDNPLISKISKSFKVEVIPRPAKISRDTSDVMLAIKHAVANLEKRGKFFDKILVLQPTSPFRKVEDINTSLNLLNNPQVDSVVSVCKAEHNPYFVMASIQNKYLNYPLIKTSKKIFSRQEAPIVYRLNGSIYAIKKEIFEKTNSLITSKTKPIVMSWKYSIDIDTPQDLLFAEFISSQE